MKLGIALYRITNDPYHPTPYFHWALALTNANEWHTNDFTIYQLQGGTPDTPNSYTWHFSKYSLIASGSFKGVVELKMNTDVMSSEELLQWVDGVVRDHPAKPDAPSNVLYHSKIHGPRGWSCATWVLIILAELEDQGVLELPDDLGWGTVYERVLEHGRLMVDLFGSVSPYPVLALGI